MQAIVDPSPAAPTNTGERLLILDFGSQVTQLIARRLRETDRLREWGMVERPSAKGED